VKKLTDIAEHAIKCFLLDYCGNFGRGQSAVEAEEVCGETGNVRSSHGSSVDGVSLPVFPGGRDVHACSPDIDNGAKIGEVGLRVIDVRSADGDNLFDAGRRGVARVLIIVSGGYDDGDTTVVKLKMESNVSGVAATFHPLSAYPFDSPVNTDGGFVTQAYGNNRGNAGPRHLIGDPISTCDTVVQ